MEGGIEYLRDVIVNDRLGIARRARAADAGARRHLPVRVDGGRRRSREAAVLPAVRQHRRDGAGHRVRDRARPAAARRLADRLRAARTARAPTAARRREPDESGRRSGSTSGRSSDFPVDGGRAIKHGDGGDRRLPLRSRGEWYACQNMCPHKREAVLSRGILGDQQGVPKVACPLHKKTFSLESGECLSGEAYRVEVFPVRVEGDDVYVELPPESEMERLARVPEVLRTSPASERTASRHSRISEPRTDEPA